MSCFLVGRAARTGQIAARRQSNCLGQRRASCSSRRTTGKSAMSPSASSPPPQLKSRLGAILRSTSGNFLEQFDFFLFGFYASYIAKAFFPTGNEATALMLTFTTFWLGALMRPIGAIVLGAYVDRIGRRKGLIVTLAIMAMGTVLIAICPSYAS